jgi:GntR family transcriptional regulator
VTATSRPRPDTKYSALAAALEDEIAGMGPHDALPTERELMRQFSVSRMTVRNALARLVARGIVYNVQGSGTYVADPEVVTKTIRLTSFTEDMQQRGLAPESRVLATSRVDAPSELARRLHVETGAGLVFVRRLRLANGTPMALEVVHLVEAGVDWPSVDLEGSLYEQLAHQGVRVVRAAQTIGALNLDAEQARHLDQAVGAAALRVQRVGLTDRGQPFEHAETLYRADRYTFDVVVAREEP